MSEHTAGGAAASWLTDWGAGRRGKVLKKVKTGEGAATAAGS